MVTADEYCAETKNSDNPCKELWAEVARQMVWDWRHLVIEGKKLYPYQIPFPTKTGFKSNDGDKITSPEFRDVVIEVLAEDIFGDDDRVGNMYWICRELYGDDWESVLEAIRDNLRKGVRVRPYHKNAA